MSSFQSKAFRLNNKLSAGIPRCDQAFSGLSAHIAQGHN
jgi:hypothetical protein